MDLIRRRLFGTARGHDAERRAEQPLRSELLSVDQLRQHARALAESHEIDRHRGSDRLLPRLAENEVALLRAYEAVSDAVKQGVRIAPAADWLLDNFHLIEEQIRTARRHLPRTYSGELPRLASGPLAGYANRRDGAGLEPPRGQAATQRHGERQRVTVSADVHVHVVLLAVVEKWDNSVATLHAIEDNPRHGITSVVADADVVERLAVAVVDFK